MRCRSRKARKASCKDARTGSSRRPPRREYPAPANLPKLLRVVLESSGDLAEVSGCADWRAVAFGSKLDDAEDSGTEECGTHRAQALRERLGLATARDRARPGNLFVRGSSLRNSTLWARHVVASRSPIPPPASTPATPTRSARAASGSSRPTGSCPQSRRTCASDTQQFSQESGARGPLAVPWSHVAADEGACKSPPDLLGGAGPTGCSRSAWSRGHRLFLPVSGRILSPDHSGLRAARSSSPRPRPSSLHATQQPRTPRHKRRPPLRKELRAVVNA